MSTSKVMTMTMTIDDYLDLKEIYTASDLRAFRSSLLLKHIFFVYTMELADCT